MNETELIEELRFHLRNFKKQGNVWNFSCPICGDSKKNKRKARGYIYKKIDKYNMTCKNCDAGMSLNNFIKLIAPELYHHFIFNKFKRKEDDFNSFLNNKTNAKEKKSPEYQFPFLIPFFESKEALSYVEERKIPRTRLKEVFFLSDLNLLIKEFEHLGYTPLPYTSPRLVFVVRNDLNEQTGFITRALNPKDTLRYYNIKIKENNSLLYGTPFLNHQKPVWIVEGIIDSLFLENSIAACSSSFQHAFEYCQKKNLLFTCVYDNERYNPQLIKIMNNTINMGYSVVVFSSFPFLGKDLNEMTLLNQWNSKTLETLLTQRIFHSLRAKLELDRWKKGF